MYYSNLKVLAICNETGAMTAFYILAQTQYAYPPPPHQCGEIWQGSWQHVSTLLWWIGGCFPLKSVSSKNWPLSPLLVSKSGCIEIARILLFSILSYPKKFKKGEPGIFVANGIIASSDGATGAWRHFPQNVFLPPNNDKCVKIKLRTRIFCFVKIRFRFFPHCKFDIFFIF